MGMENTKCRALLELLQGRQKLTAINIQRLFGWGNSRTLRLLATMQDSGLITPEPGRPGMFLVHGDAVTLGIPPAVIDLVSDVLGNGEFLPLGGGEA